MQGALDGRTPGQPSSSQSSRLRETGTAKTERKKKSTTTQVPLARLSAPSLLVRVNPTHAWRTGDSHASKPSRKQFATSHIRHASNNSHTRKLGSKCRHPPAGPRHPAPAFSLLITEDRVGRRSRGPPEQPLVCSAEAQHPLLRTREHGAEGHLWIGSEVSSPSFYLFLGDRLFRHFP